VNFVCFESPSNIVIFMNPDFIREEGQRLASSIMALCAPRWPATGLGLDTERPRLRAPTCRGKWPNTRWNREISFCLPSGTVRYVL
jgi:hypothetical protein